MHLNGKVIQYDLPDGSMFANLIDGIRKDGHYGQEVLFHKYLYDPKYGVVKSFADMTREMAAGAEDSFVDAINDANLLKDKTKVVGLIDLIYKGDKNTDLKIYYHPASQPSRALKACVIAA